MLIWRGDNLSGTIERMFLSDDPEGRRQASISLLSLERRMTGLEWLAMVKEMVRLAPTDGGLGEVGAGPLRT